MLEFRAEPQCELITWTRPWRSVLGVFWGLWNGSRLPARSERNRCLLATDSSNFHVQDSESSDRILPVDVSAASRPPGRSQPHGRGSASSDLRAGSTCQAGKMPLRCMLVDDIEDFLRAASGLLDRRVWQLSDRRPLAQELCNWPQVTELRSFSSTLNST